MIMTSHIRFSWFLGALIVILPLAAWSQTVDHRDPGIIEKIINDIRVGWEHADGAPFKQHFLDYKGARYVESGGQNEGLQDLIEHHVVPEGDALELLLAMDDVEVHFEGHDFAWAIANVVVQATIKKDGRKIHKKGYETFLFRFIDGQWKVVHTHSSTRSVK